MHRTDTRSRRALAGAILALAMAWAPHAQARCSITFVEMPVKLVGHRAVATVGINGVDVPLLVDTGAYFSALPESTAAQLKLPLQRAPAGFKVQGITGDMEQPRMTRARLGLLGGEIPASFIVGGNEIGEGVRGILGRDVLGVVDTEFDLAHGVIRLASPVDCGKSNMAYWAGNTPISEVGLLGDASSTPAMRAFVKINGRETLAMFDSGATTMVSLDAAHKAGIRDADMKEEGGIFGVGQGRARSWSADFATVSLGGETVSNNRLAIGDYEIAQADMLVGIDFFLSHRLYVSPSRARMFFTYNGGPVFARNVSAAAPAASGVDTLDAEAHARRGAVALARSDFAGALQDLDRAHAQAPGNAQTLVLRSNALLGLGRRPAAQADLDEALRLEPANVTALLARATMRTGLDHGNPAAADLAILDQALPPQAHEHMRMAELYGQMRRYDAAIAQWTKWIDAHPHDLRLAQAYSDRCWARVALDRESDAAARDCDQAAVLDSKDPHTFDASGWLALRRGRMDEARAAFEKSLALQPDGAWSLYGRGLVRQRQGDANGAQADFSAARKAEPDIDAGVRADGLPTAPDAPAK